MDAESKLERWVICPVCHKGNPVGARYCQHCWGAVLNPDITVAEEELEEVTRRREAYLKKARIIKRGLMSFGIFTALLAVFLTIYSYTDLIMKPAEYIDSSSQPGEWTMFRYDLGRSGSAESTGIVPQGTQKWVFSTDGGVHSSAAVVDGILYIGSRDRNFYALDADTGAKKWEYQTGSWVESSPAVTGGVVYFGSNDGRLYALDAKSGEGIWDFRTPYPVRCSPAIADGVVYFGSDDYYFYALDTEDGEELWKYDTDRPAGSSPVVSGGVVYIGSGGYCYTLNAQNGQQRLRFRSHYTAYTSPVVNDGVVYFTVSNGYIYAVDGSARTRWREHELRPYWTQIYAMGVPGVPEPPVQSGLLWAFQLDGTPTSPALVDDILYVGVGNKLIAIDLESIDEELLAKNARNYEVEWEFETGGEIQSSPAVVDNVVYVGSEDGRLYAIDATTGEKLWDFLTGDKITSSPIVVDGVVYVGSHDGNVYAIE
ncbi:PQQ-binding-like beta-propeller repeat protein [Chloroflexota bacterium]